MAPPRIPDPDPHEWPDYPLLAVRSVIGGEIVRGVMVDGGGYTVYRTSLPQARTVSIDSHVGISWATAFSERFLSIRYASAEAFYEAGWRVDTDD